MITKIITVLQVVTPCSVVARGPLQPSSGQKGKYKPDDTRNKPSEYLLILTRLYSFTSYSTAMFVCLQSVCSKLCIYFSFRPYTLHIPPVSFSLISPLQVQSVKYAQYAVPLRTLVTNSVYFMNKYSPQHKSLTWPYGAK